MKIKEKLDIASNVIIILTGIVFIYVIGTNYVVPGIVSHFRLRRGESVQGINVDWNQHEATLLVAMRVGCQYCAESIPFYQKLLQMEKSGATSAYILAAFPDDPAATQQYLQLHGMHVQSIRINLAQLGITGTPTLILVDHGGHIIRKWIGVLSQSEEQEVIAALTPLASARRTTIP